jgi:hypothetical protein
LTQLSLNFSRKSGWAEKNFQGGAKGILEGKINALLRAKTAMTFKPGYRMIAHEWPDAWFRPVTWKN